ncbi:MAG: type II toxin-antitoxin system HicB family antitoxin [Candidatus Asgardarchaeia archaeon]
MGFRAVFWKEDDHYVIKEIFTGTTTQGRTIEEAIKNLEEALELYLEEMPGALRDIENTTIIGEIDVKTPKPFRA